MFVYNRGGQLVFVWDRLENFLLTRDRPVGDKVTGTLPKFSTTPSPYFNERAETKRDISWTIH